MSAIDEKALAAATAAVTSEIDRYWKDDTVEPGHGLVAEAAVSAYLAALAPQQAAPMPVTIIHGSPIARFVQSYQFDASDEGIVHTPTHDEQCMIEDAICSFISDERLLHEALGITPEAGTSEPVADHGWLYFNEDTGTEWSPNHPVESGEVPDATQVRPCSEETRYWIDELVKRDAELLTLRTTHPTPAQAPVDGEAVRALREAEQAFEAIRILLVKDLDEPGRTAFWRAVGARDAIRTALAAPSAQKEP